jgi:hypothetical protein
MSITPGYRPQLDQWFDVPDYDCTSKVLQDFKEDFNRDGVRAFIKANPTFPRTQANSEAMQEWFTSHQLPMSRNNLTIAWRELEAAGKIEDAPAVTEVSDELRGNLHKVEIKPVVARQVAPPTKAEKKLQESLADDSNLTDHQRKARLKKLGQAANAQRIAGKKVVDVVIA